MEAVYLQKASASTPIASACKRIHRNFANKNTISALVAGTGSVKFANRNFFSNTLQALGQTLASVFLKIVSKKQTKI